MKTFMRVLISSIVILLPVFSFGSEAVKLSIVRAIYLDEKGTSIKQPEGVACDGQTLVIADTGNNRLLRYTYQNKDVLGGTEIKIPQVSFPIKVQFNSKREIFVLNGKAFRVVRLSPSGEFAGYLEPEGLPSPSAFVARSFRIGKDDQIYILDIFSGRVIVLKPDGKFVRYIGFPKEYGFFSDLAVDSSGNVFLIDSVNAEVFSASSDSLTFSPLSKPLKEYLDFPANIETDASGFIYVVDQDSGGVAVLSRDGSLQSRQLSYGWNEGLLRYPSQICVDKSGNAFITDRENSRVQFFILVR